MATYMLMANYSKDALKQIIAKGSNREEAARSAIEAAGGRLLGFYGMFGQEYQIAIICEAPGNAEYMGGIIPAIAAGVLEDWKTIPLYSADEVMKASAIAKKVSKAYKAPGK